MRSEILIKQKNWNYKQHSRFFLYNVCLLPHLELRSDLECAHGPRPSLNETMTQKMKPVCFTCRTSLSWKEQVDPFWKKFQWLQLLFSYTLPKNIYYFKFFEKKTENRFSLLRFCSSMQMVAALLISIGDEPWMGDSLVVPSILGYFVQSTNNYML